MYNVTVHVYKRLYNLTADGKGAMVQLLRQKIVEAWVRIVLSVVIASTSVWLIDTSLPHTLWLYFGAVVVIGVPAVAILDPVKAWRLQKAWRSKRKELISVPE